MIARNHNLFARNLLTVFPLNLDATGSANCSRFGAGFSFRNRFASTNTRHACKPSVVKVVSSFVPMTASTAWGIRNHGKAFHTASVAYDREFRGFLVGSADRRACADRRHDQAPD